MAERIGLLGLGSNVGDREGNLQAAVHAIAAAGITLQASSSLYDTDPVGEILDQPSFLNACLQIATELAPLQLLDLVKDIERQLGRELDAPRHSPRVIDIDILLLGDTQLHHPRITLPHEQLLARRFVLIPALEIDFSMVAPQGGRLADALAALPVDEGVRWAGPPLRLPQDGKDRAHPES